MTRASSPQLPAVGLVEACDDPQLFGFPLWPKQRAILTDVERKRLSVWALGRRSGKTTCMALVGLHSCLLRPGLRDPLRPGERGWAVAIATSLRQARLLTQAALSIVERSPLLSPMLTEASGDEILFSNGMGLASFPCTSRGGRGWAIHTLLLDELAFFVDTEGNAAAEPIYRALTPATVQFGADARIIASSTPFGESGLFSNLYEQAQAGALEDAIAQQASTVEANPTIDAAFLERERIILGAEAFDSEYGAQFVGSGGAFLAPEQIEDAIGDRDDLRPEDATDWVCGIDPAFSRDPFGLVLVGQDRERGTLVLGLARRWLPVASRPRSFEERRLVEDEVLAEVAAIARHFQARVWTDQFSAPAVVERLKAAGLSVHTEAMTATSKSLAYSELRARLAASELELYPQPELIAELRRLRSRFSAGHASVVNPRSGDSHGDIVQALALAVYAQRSWSKHSRPATVSIPRGRIGGVWGSDPAALSDLDAEIARVSGQVVTVRTRPDRFYEGR